MEMEKFKYDSEQKQKLSSTKIIPTATPNQIPGVWCQAGTASEALTLTSWSSL